jgi:hypothetical protein
MSFEIESPDSSIQWKLDCLISHQTCILAFVPEDNYYTIDPFSDYLSPLEPKNDDVHDESITSSFFDRGLAIE